MKLLYVALLAIGLSGNPNDGSTITLDRNFKVESTFSGTTSADQSFHLIVAKNTKKKHFEIIPVLNNNGELKRLDPIIFDKEPSILSFHNNEGVVSLIVSSKGKKHDNFTVVGVDTDSGEHAKSDAISGEDFKAVIRKNDKNILLFSNKERLDIVEVIGVESFKKTAVEITEDDLEFIKDMNNASLEAVNTDEFVANGSINEFRAYSDGETVFITREDVKNGTTSVSNVKLNNGVSAQLETKTYKANSKEKIKKSTSFVNDGSLYQLQLNKSKGDLNVFNLSNEDNSTLDLAKLNISSISEGFTDMDEFLKNAAKSGNEPTISINKNTSGDITMRADYVNKREYYYQYNWWWHHHWFIHNTMMWQHQQNLPRPPVPSGYGPSQVNVDMYYYKKESHFFEVVFNANNENIAVESAETVHKYIDKKTHIDELEDNTRIKHGSSVFMKDELRYFGYDKKTKVFKVITRRLND